MGLNWRRDDLLTWEERRIEAERKKLLEQLPDTVSALQSALEDADALNVDQEYRLTLLELGITDFE